MECGKIIISTFSCPESMCSENTTSSVISTAAENEPLPDVVISIPSESEDPAPGSEKNPASTISNKIPASTISGPVSTSTIVSEAPAIATRYKKTFPAIKNLTTTERGHASGRSGTTDNVAKAANTDEALQYSSDKLVPIPVCLENYNNQVQILYGGKKTTFYKLISRGLH